MGSQISCGCGVSLVVIISLTELTDWLFIAHFFLAMMVFNVTCDICLSIANGHHKGGGMEKKQSLSSNNLLTAVISVARNLSKEW